MTSLRCVRGSARAAYGSPGHVVTAGALRLKWYAKEAKTQGHQKVSVLLLQSGEFLISKTGGTVNVDGVQVEQNDRDFPDYEPNQKYLLLINLYPAGTARTIGGPVGVFRILQNEKVVPLRESEHRIRKDFKEEYGNSLELLRKHLK